MISKKSKNPRVSAWKATYRSNQSATKADSSRLGYYYNIVVYWDHRLMQRQLDFNLLHTAHFKWRTDDAHIRASSEIRTQYTFMNRASTARIGEETAIQTRCSPSHLPRFFLSSETCQLYNGVGWYYYTLLYANTIIRASNEFRTRSSRAFE